MISYMRLGDVPKKRHIVHRREAAQSYKGEGLYYEHVITTEGFDRAYSIRYHLRPPTRVKDVQIAAHMPLERTAELPLRAHHLKSAQLPRVGDALSGRVPLLFNEDVVCSRCKPMVAMKTLYRNAGADEVVFIYSGGGVMESPYGRLPYREGDYIIIPRGTTYLLKPHDAQLEDYLILESGGAVRLPKRYVNPDGQIMLGAPYYHRDFHGPTEPIFLDKDEDTPILVKDGARVTRVTLAQHPFDVIGWDGFVYPFTFNVEDFEPITGTVHMPPPVQQTFECRGFVICTFAPRYLDHHPDAVKVPYVHSNVEADEVLFYVRGNFGSRKGIESGSFSLHPRGIPHGPHPGTILRSLKETHTEELAVMFDTERTLALTPQALTLDDPKYPLSWVD